MYIRARGLIRLNVPGKKEFGNRKIKIKRVTAGARGLSGPFDVTLMRELGNCDCPAPIDTV